VGLDSLLACIYSRGSERDRLAREVSEGSTVLFDSTVWLAFLGGVCRAHLDSTIVRYAVLQHLEGGGTLIEKCFSENLPCWKFNWRDEMVSQ
jgi:hypothetical protein